MVMVKPAWLLERELSSQLLKVGNQLITLPSSPKDFIELLDKVGTILSQVYQNFSRSIQDILVPIKGVLISDMLTNHADLDVRISLASCFFELLRITSPNPPFEDEHMKKVFQIIVSSCQALPGTTNKSSHKRLHILECMARVKSYVILLDLECDALVLDIFYNLLASPKDDHPAMTLAYVESILVGILTEADNLLLEFLISILYQSHRVISRRVLDVCASRIPLRQIIPFIDEITQIKENKVKEGPNEEGVGFKSANEEYQNATYECKTLPNYGDFWCPEFYHVEMSRLESGHFDLFIPNALPVDKKLHPLIGFLIFL